MCDVGAHGRNRNPSPHSKAATARSKQTARRGTDGKAPREKPATETSVHPWQLARCAELTGRAPQHLPGRISRDACSLLLRLRLDCASVVERLHRHAQRASPNCASCPEPETLEHLIQSCTQRAAPRAQLQAPLQRLGIPSRQLDNLLFPAESASIRRQVFQLLLDYLVATELAQWLQACLWPMEQP